MSNQPFCALPAGPAGLDRAFDVALAVLKNSDAPSHRLGRETPTIFEEQSEYIKISRHIGSVDRYAVETYTHDMHVRIDIEVPYDAPRRGITDPVFFHVEAVHNATQRSLTRHLGGGQFLRLDHRGISTMGKEDEPIIKASSGAASDWPQDWMLREENDRTYDHTDFDSTVRVSPEVFAILTPARIRNERGIVPEITIERNEFAPHLVTISAGSVVVRMPDLPLHSAKFRAPLS